MSRLTIVSSKGMAKILEILGFKEIRQKGSHKIYRQALLFQKEPRKVSNDGYVSYGGNFYPVPMRCALRRVWVENIYGRHLRVYDEAGRLLAEFDLEIKKQTVRPPHPEHE